MKKQRIALGMLCATLTVQAETLTVVATDSRMAIVSSKV